MRGSISATSKVCYCLILFSYKNWKTIVSNNSPLLSTNYQRTQRLTGTVEGYVINNEAYEIDITGIKKGASRTLERDSL
jgi:hypothetical protein